MHGNRTGNAAMVHRVRQKHPIPGCNCRIKNKQGRRPIHPGTLQANAGGFAILAGKVRVQLGRGKTHLSRLGIYLVGNNKIGPGAISPSDLNPGLQRRKVLNG